MPAQGRLLLDTWIQPIAHRRYGLYRLCLGAGDGFTLAPVSLKTLVLGLGNDILSDDAVGLILARRLAEELSGIDGVEVRETMEMGLALLDFLVDCDAVLILDAIQTGQVPPGTLHEVDPQGLGALTGRTPHFVGVGETLALGRQLGFRMPDRVTVLAVEVEDPFTLGTRMTPAVADAVPRVMERALAVIREGLGKAAA
jgi:hydrogenase maturation protease